jgi:VWFA-related protein
MHRLSNITFLLLTVSLLLAQTPAAPEEKEDGETTFRADARLVVLHASVVDKDGRLITNLRRSAFKVFENNVEQPIKMFKREDVPVSLGLLVDNSGSMRDKRKRVEAATLAAVKASNPRDEIIVVNFNDEAYDDTMGFTADIRKLEEALTKIDSRGGTAMRDSLDSTIDFVKKKGKHDKKVIMIVSDGDDTASVRVSLEKLVQKAHDTEVLLYFIGILGEEDKRAAKRAKRAMDALAQASGGTAVYPDSLEAVETIALSIANELRNQYVITYSPTNQALDGTFRTIKVVATGKNRPTVRTRSGYYATPDKKAGTATAQVR